jgi:hypothetical protein
MKSASRVAFEKWYRSQNGYAPVWLDGTYGDKLDDAQWTVWSTAWRAARRSVMKRES